MNSFPQLRRDPIVDRWTLIAPERAQRPGAIVVPAALPNHEAECPFCEGREERTPPEVFALRSPDSPVDGPGWRARVIPNRFPAVRIDAAGPLNDEPFVTRPGVGGHELIVECPQHVASLSALPVEHVAEVFGVIRARLRFWRDSGQFAYAQVFKNHGTAAGASLAHAHSQIIALPEVPPALRAELTACERHRAAHGRCLFCDLIEREFKCFERHIGDRTEPGAQATDDSSVACAPGSPINRHDKTQNARVAGSRVIRKTPAFVLLTAFAGRFPYETWLLPRRHAERFEELPDAELSELAEAMHWLLQRLEAVAGGPAYNLVLHSAPWNGAADYHWHFELLPRMTGVAGFEWGTGMFINPLPPEVAAERLRESTLVS